MKKAVILVLAVLYMSVTSGVMVNVHYCMGRIASVKYGAEKDKACDQCGMQQKKGCCHTEHKLLKADQAHLSVNQQFIFAGDIAMLPPVYDLLSADLYRSRDHYNCLYHSPPDQRSNSLSLYNGVLRI